MVNGESIDHEQESLPSSHVYCSPEHVTNLNFGEDEPSLDILYNPYMQTEGEFKVGDIFHTKEYCVRVIKSFTWKSHLIIPLFELM